MLIILGACLGLGSCMVGVVVGGGGWGVTNLPPPFSASRGD